VNSAVTHGIFALSEGRHAPHNRCPQFVVPCLMAPSKAIQMNPSPATASDFLERSRVLGDGRLQSTPAIQPNHLEIEDNAATVEHA